MGDYTVKDTLTNSNSNNNSNQSQQQAQQNQSSQQNGRLVVKDENQGSQGTTATQQELPQTGINSYAPQMMFGGSAVLLMLAVAFKLGTLVNRR